MTCLASLAGCQPCYERLAGLVWPTISCVIKWSANRRFPEITGEDNLTVFSYSGRVKSPEWRWQRRRADLRHFEIFRHGPIIIYIRLPAGGTYYPICTFPASSECLIAISDAFSAFCLRVSVTDLPHVLTLPPTKACLLCATPAGMDLYICPKAHTGCSPLDFRRSSISYTVICIYYWWLAELHNLSTSRVNRDF